MVAPKSREDFMGSDFAGRLAPAFVALAALLPWRANAETLAELYEKAKAEKEVVFYSGGPAAPHENRAKLFMQQYPGDLGVFDEGARHDDLAVALFPAAQH